MKILRIVDTKVIDVSNITVTFTENLTPSILPSNITIISNTPNIPSSLVKTVTITGSVLSIVCQPLTPLSSYFVTFQSLPNFPFESLNGDAVISTDGISNQVLISAPLAPDDIILNYLNSFLYGNIYNNTDSNTITSKYLNSLSINLSKALYDIRQIKNENYLTVSIKDESKVRGLGPFDRLNEEGAYEIVRVGFTPTGTTVNNTFQFNSFPNFPVTLQSQSVMETLTPNSIDQSGFFNINSLTLNVNNNPVTKVNSITFTLNTNTPNYTYNIIDLGYQIQNSRYDQTNAFSYSPLANNQIRLSDTILSDPLFSLANIINVTVQYEYKNLGIIVDPVTVSVYTTQTSSREAIPPIINIFNLAHAPITDSSNNIPTLNGVIFTDPNSNGLPHPAFINEITFSLSSLPFMPGQYAIDYTAGTVYVYGNDIANDGTGPYPPLATYQYRLTYQSEIDYVYDPDLLDLVSLPNGSLINFPGNIFFNYEQVLIPGVDYVSNPHAEALAEYVNNNIIALNAVTAQNSPITNVFKIYNETSGEIYNLDRWYNNIIYFTYNTPPRIMPNVGERATFNIVNNELLFAFTSLINSNNVRIFKLLLANNTIVSSTEDSIASSFNTSLVFTNGNIFVNEKWFNAQFTEAQNINRLSIGQYMVDYTNGIVYCGVFNTQNTDIGTVTYKNNQIVPIFPHIISVDDIYYSISSLTPKNKTFSYVSFVDGLISPQILDISDEAYLNSNLGAPYQIYNGSIGIFVYSNFVAGVTNQIKYVRSIFEYDDLLNSTNPFNFATSSSSSGFNINVNNYYNQFIGNVQFNGSNHYVTIDQNIPYLSDNITYSFTVTRLSDSAQLWNTSGTVGAGNPLTLILPEINSPHTGDQVSITYTFSINNLSRVIIDYNKGDFFIDYTYLADNIIISYEYGDNQLDFRQNTNLPSGTTYFASYKVGALRDALYKNFGTLVNVPVLATFDVDFNRERYRDALIAALTSFIQGPTISAIKNIAQTISHIEPEIIESAFLNWSLGSSLLFPQPVNSTGSYQLLPAKFGNRALINDSSQAITLPASSNLRLEEGTFETWICPQWNGLDNDGDLTFQITQNGTPILSNRVFLGSAEYHPLVNSNKFTINKNSNVIGTPNFNKDGIFIYYDFDTTGSYYRWYVKVIDGYVSSSSSYNFKITSVGKIYDNQSLTYPTPSNINIFTGTNSINFSITGGGSLNEGFTFLADTEHYLLDFGEQISKNRLSIFKDSSGYLNFRVIDKDKSVFSISADISNWKIGTLHQVSASWKLNTRNNRDEMHLFIDGFEVPNIIKYGQKLQPYLHENFRTVDPEEVIGLSNRDIVGSVDLQTTAGNNSVSSSLNFSSFKIFVGDTIFIDAVGFSPNGYSIIGINGQTLILNAVMPATISNGVFSVNRTKFTVTSDIDIAANIAVSTIHTVITGTDLNGSINTSMVTSSINFAAQNILPGYTISISSISNPIVYTIIQVSGNSLTINGTLPINIAGVNFNIYSNTEVEIPGVRAVRPSYSISQDLNYNNILTVSNNVFANDLILIRTLGLNSKKVKKQYYVWSDGYENILMTRLLPPISLNETNIYKIILPNTSVNSSNSTVVGNVFTTNLTGTQPSNLITGRSIAVTLSGNNVNFASPVSVTINGLSNSHTTTETLNFTNYGSMNFINSYNQVNSITVTATAVNVSKNICNILLQEANSITYPEFDGYAPIIRFSYPINSGYNLFNDSSSSVRDVSNLFSAMNINNYLFIQSPAPVAGYYLITGISTDRKSLYISTTSGVAVTLPNFTNGIYQILNVNSYRSGFQNGFFTFERTDLPGQPYLLNHGFYQLEYSTYANIKLDFINDLLYFGSDFKGNNQLDGIINQSVIYSTMLTDTRVGETTTSNQRSITKDFNSLKPLTSDINTLALITFNNYPFTNDASFYTNSEFDRQHFQSSIVINENFNNSLVILDKPVVVENTGILDTKKQGTIEFWVNPLFDTGNDPNERFYFDAFGAISEQAVSINDVSVKLSTPASKILSVKLSVGDQTDYFAGGRLEIDTQNAIQEEGMSISNDAVLTSNFILQVITVKIIGDLSGTDYFAGGAIGSDGKTIYLGKLLPGNGLPLLITYQSTNNQNTKLNSQVIRLNKKLPNQNTNVIVNYIPQGLQGDRISIYKDLSGYLNFGISASGTDYIVRAPMYWAKDTWHRVKASYKINGGAGSDEMRLFIDGYQYTNVTFGSEILFGQYPVVFGQSIVGGFTPNDGYSFIENIVFKDQINQFYIGSQYTETKPIFSLIDNFRISNISRPIYAPFGEPIDINYSSNLSTVFPVTQDLYTTYLMNFDQIVSLNTDFATLKDRETGSFDFTVNVLDSLGIINSSEKSKEALNSLVNILKPANSRVLINYIT